MHLIRTALALCVLLAVGACVSPRPLVIDTWRVGEPVDCRDGRCPAALDAGLRGLDARDPGHAPLESASLHTQAACRDPATGQEVLRTTSGGPIWVLVATLTDGTTHAIGVGYPGISQEPVVINWDQTTGCP